jgi:hypothetical protein
MPPPTLQSTICLRASAVATIVRLSISDNLAISRCQTHRPATPPPFLAAAALMAVLGRVSPGILVLLGGRCMLAHWVESYGAVAGLWWVMPWWW